MVQRNGMLGLVRFRMLRAGISKYSTLRLASSSSLSAASLAIPTRAILYLRLLFASWQEEFSGRDRGRTILSPATVGHAPSPGNFRYRGVRADAQPFA